MFIGGMIVRTLPYFNYVAYSVGRAVTHPLSPIRWGWCTQCEKRVHPNEGRCPACNHVIEQNPEHYRESPIPWWGSILALFLGIVLWVLSDQIPVPSLAEPARLLTYGPIGNLFGLGTRKPTVDRKK